MKSSAIPDSRILYFFVPGQPVPFMRADRSGKYTYTPPRMAKWEIEIKEVAFKLQVEPFVGDLGMVMRFHRQDKRRADVDNMGKNVADALQGVLYANDNQLTWMLPTVRYEVGKANAGVEVWLMSAAIFERRVKIDLPEWRKAP